MGVAAFPGADISSLLAVTAMAWQVVDGPRAQLGEGLHWDTLRGCLWMTDILGAELRRWWPGTGLWQSWQLPQRLGWVLPHVEDGTVLLGLQGGLARTRDALAVGIAPELAWVARPFAGRPSLRLNDAKADSTGAVWAGSLNHEDESLSEGCLYRLGIDGKLSVVDEGYKVANGPAISADERLMLHTDSGRRLILAFDLDVVAGTLARRRVWQQFSPAEGYPDGMCFDAEGCVWVAHWDGACVSRFTPDGSLLRREQLPTSQITNVCFGGRNLDRLFVSSACVGLLPEQLVAEPLAGALFEIIDPGVRGLAAHPWRGVS